MATGTAISGMSTARQFCRKTSTTTPTRITASNSVLHHVGDRLADERRGVVGDLVVDAVGEARLQLLHLALARGRRRRGRWCRGAGRRRGRPTAGRRRCRTGCSSGRPFRRGPRRGGGRCRPTAAAVRPAPSAAAARRAADRRAADRPAGIVRHRPPVAGADRRASAAGRRRRRRSCRRRLLSPPPVVAAARRWRRRTARRAEITLFVVVIRLLDTGDLAVRRIGSPSYRRPWRRCWPHCCPAPPCSSSRRRRRMRRSPPPTWERIGDCRSWAAPEPLWTGAADAGGRRSGTAPADLDDDVAELLRIAEPAQRVDRQLERLAPRAPAAGRSARPAASRFWLRIAAATSPAVMSQRGQLLRVEPGADAVVALAEDVDVRDAVHAQQLVLDVDRGVVAQVEVVVAAVRRDRS